MDDTAFTDWFEQVRAKHKGRSLSLSLWNHADDGRGSQIDAWDVPDQLDVTPIWNDVQKVAQKDAELLRGTQTYAIMVSVGAACIARRLFQLEGGRIERLAGRGTPEDSVVPALLRHLENKERVMIRLVEGCIGGLAKENERLLLRNEKLEMRDQERAEGYERLLSKQQERDLATTRQKAELQLKQEIANDMRMLAPHIANKLIGHKALPEGPLSPDMMSLRAFLESITPEQMAKLQDTLNPAQGATVMEFYNTYVLKKGSGNART